MSDNEREQESGAATVQEIAGGQAGQAVFPSSVVRGPDNPYPKKQKPMVLFSLPSDVSNEEET